jgi:hypothetical protein
LNATAPDGDGRQRDDRYGSLEDRVSVALAAAGLVMWEFDPDGRTVRWDGSDGARLETGVDRYEALLELIDPQDRTRVAEAIVDCVERGAAVDIEFRSLTAEGQLTWRLARGQRYRADTRDPWRVVGLSGDITARKRGELEQEQMLETEQRAVRQLSQLQMVSEAGLSRLPLEDLLVRLLELVREALSSDSATVLLLNEQRSRLAGC